MSERYCKDLEGWVRHGAALFLFIRAGLIGGEPDHSPASILASASTGVAWLLAAVLNVFEHRYEIRSSTAIFTYYMANLIAGAITTRTLNSLSSNTTTNALYYTYFAFILLGFLVEAWPRSDRKQVNDHLTAAAAAAAAAASPYEKANIFSRYWFYYLQDLITLGYKRPLQPSDLEDMMPYRIKTVFSYQHLSQRWDHHVNRRKVKGQEPRLMWLVLTSYGSQWIPIIIYRVLSSASGFIAPQLMSQLLDFTDEASRSSSPDSTESSTPLILKPATLGIILSFGMFFSTIVSSLLEGQFYQLIMNMGIEVRTAVVSMIYRKALRLSPSARQSQSPGEINNHMSVDAERWSEALQFLPMWGSIPLEICIAIWLLYRQLGWSALAGLGTILAVMPLQGWIAAFFEKAKGKRLKAMDNRIRLTNELMSNMKIIKLYGWESAFRDKVATYRNRELSILRKLGVTFSFMTIAFSSITLLMALASFSIYATFGGPGGTPGDINPKTIFVSITLFGLLNRPIGMLSYVTSETIGLVVATRRIQKYLLEEELSDDQIERSQNLPADPAQPVIEVKNGTFGWEKADQAGGGEELKTATEKERKTREKNETKEEDNDALPIPMESSPPSTAEPKHHGPILKNIHLTVQRTHLTAIVGRVGQGKSSLFHAIIGDMYKHRGTVKMFGQLAYAPQQAWIMNATLKDNILFGSVFDREKYDRIIYAAGLIPDIEILPAGDQTEIGERGINLSGGQKQRVSLARAAYQDADIYLLDDPLSAVDAHVDRHLWEHMIGPNGLLKDKTRLLITHGIHHLSEVDQIVVVRHGIISEVGRYEELLDAKNAFYRLIQDYSSNNKGSENGSDYEEEVEGKENETIKESEAGLSGHGGPVARVQALDEMFDSNADLIVREAMEVGSIHWHVYKLNVGMLISTDSVGHTFHNNVLGNSSYRKVVQVLLLFVIVNACQIGTNSWLQNWIRVAHVTTHGIGYYMGVYAALIIVFMLLIVWTSYTTMVTTAVRASERLHSNLLNNILRLPMTFFDTTPVGRVINRFSSDLFSIDEQIPWSFHDTFFCGGAVIGSLIVISVTTPIFLIVIPPILIMYIFIQRYYITSSRNFKRIESIAKSPMYQHFSETLSGASTIRALQCNTRFIEQNATRSDNTANAFFVWAVGNRWLEIRLEFLGSIVVLAASLLAVLSRETLPPSMVGMSLAYALNITQDICWLVKCMCQVQFEMVSVERVNEYCQKDQEAPNWTDVPIPDSWPAHGHVVFKNYSTRYRPGMDLVLRNVSFDVKPGERIGIVGRTGAGKSSLTLALFRIIEAANSQWDTNTTRGGSNDQKKDGSDVVVMTELEKVQAEEDGGSIWIDDIDIATIGLETLRQHLAIIPQDPTLFVGTVRDNLDPFQQATDTEVWEALDRAHLKDYLVGMPGGLSYEVTHNGDNFSVGQRSLICLARALLRKTKILILDEATAAVDVETDELIQRTIREEFKDRTVLTIAHRIKTIMDYDKILVLDKGRVQEFEAPSQLLNLKDSLFYNLAEQAGAI
ncbi:Canalicular multispecific organic anion transporter 2 [Modicella reniformis]|uniref:Canalicular multispecific organic anion transporter 2 n=1 Tax=Modicella reniformis TaxID=1440133 RepID=A0A9P6SUC9_9FUNG|nr:Canalicular multispecific organic anion transporter 2 [Modicella reniformis]